ncbi:MAG TPA: aldehyde dehydrogenase family protein [Gammaproteobacteria bacterium]|jgi:aldehyde dehydrogenase (NAD+)|uniref:aldehyde dehydrogenase (NAD(+)) n=1 Tax=uncultured Oceanospirillales bacterium HF4000_23O15 TaxID=710746 RepID=E0XW02_9GAMM|nr:NAD-dependent aldehyde dehydrogenases [uncultured Oceanospirillales bacterium HF4000_23O15]HIF85380.1 aldehyde dehydrogenase family protein [Gammaproteobacteria bacterium]HIL62580.1 aldehyde dehydrogenase family protein [Porticoccaceae bacterium]HIN89342.1 aldehyde dehydrogenase family protein [Porticoccaceae bacterium]|tara:strand:+ start:5604 stop:7136 length:1533 start_codon:yes stop_codon:yes gene_type:complete
MNKLDSSNKGADRSQLATDLLKQIGVDEKVIQTGDLIVSSPVDGLPLGQVKTSSAAAVDSAIAQSVQAYEQWKTVPAPRRGELIRVFGNKLREHKQTLGALVTMECGKIYQEALGEVQEMIDICDFAVGLSRQLYGLTIASERPGHRMAETWHPIGPVGVISAFNFPVAVWCWNTALAVVCGDSVIWKPSDKTPITAIACQHLFEQAMAELDDVPDGLSQLIIGAVETGVQLVADKRMALISATGSTAMGRKVGPVVAARFGRSLLELGGNNAIIVCPSADLDMAVRAILFGAVGTAGQRCTSTRRLFVHEDIYEALVGALKQAYARIRVGNPMDAQTLVGPLIDAGAYESMQQTLSAVGAKVIGGERVLGDEYPQAFYVNPALVEMPAADNTVQKETFAPILYVYAFKLLEEAIRQHNDVPQGLSSAIFSNDIREAELFLSAAGSDCGIANVNIGTSGAEIGGAFGGEKETGGGRESGSDAWKAYMRRATSTINYSKQLPLAQGIEFNL